MNGGRAEHKRESGAFDPQKFRALHENFFRQPELFLPRRGFVSRKRARPPSLPYSARWSKAQNPRMSRTLRACPGLLECGDLSPLLPSRLVGVALRAFSELPRLLVAQERAFLLAELTPTSRLRRQVGYAKAVTSPRTPKGRDCLLGAAQAHLEECQGSLQSFLDFDLRLPTQNALGFGNVGTALFGIVFWKRLKFDGRIRFRHAFH